MTVSNHLGGRGGNTNQENVRYMTSSYLPGPTTDPTHMTHMFPRPTTPLVSEEDYFDIHKFWTQDGDTDEE